jgi:Rps23 Pro-64 3,4-dihydroxylase Tpa1-like proline 4-hydroxylase
MTAKRILDAFSETLMQDERILSSCERELLTNILQTSKTISGSNPATQSAVTATIAQSVGETVAQRAFALLGGSIVEQMLAGAKVPASEEPSRNRIFQFGVPQPPTGVPQPPSAPPKGIPQPVPQPPSSPMVPQPPSGPKGMTPRTVAAHEDLPTRLDSRSSVDILQSSAMGQSASVVLDEFLAPHELDELIAYTSQHENDFQNSEVISPSGEPGVIDFSHRRSRVLMDLGKHQAVILERIQSVLPRVLERLGLEEFPVAYVEAQITASNDGDFFAIHSDDAQESIASRRITFVYFFHREPRPFEGGELRLYDPAGSGTRSYQTIEPQQNQIVFFPCSVSHEITRVECPSRAFADSRFTLNGWLHK